MQSFKLVVKEPSNEESAYLENSINNYNINLTGIPFGGKLAVMVYDENNQLIGGVNGFQWGDAFTVEVLWIEEEWRGQDIGSQVLRAIEDQAAARGCTQVYLDTYNFQAIGFYQKLGYEVLGTLENFPTPYTHYFLKKNLSGNR
jgi:ribosomal protein S18 acetylase RimI-like enzyme